MPRVVHLGLVNLSDEQRELLEKLTDATEEDPVTIIYLPTALNIEALMGELVARGINGNDYIVLPANVPVGVVRELRYHRRTRQGSTPRIIQSGAFVD